MHPTINIGEISIYTYTLAGLLGLFFGIIAAIYCDPKNKKIRSDIFYCALYCIIGGLVGGKILYVITIIPEIIQNPKILLYAIKSGMVFYGGLIGGIAGGYIYVKQYKVEFWSMSDSLAVGLPVGHFFGRLGCFAAGCCYGKPYDGIFSVIFPKESLSAPSGISLHPVQLYEATFNLFLFFFLLIIKRKSNKKALVTFLYLIFYGIARFILEMYRFDVERGFIGTFSTSQFISLFVIIAGFFGLVYSKSRNFYK